MTKCETCHGIGLVLNGHDTEGPLLPCPDCDGTGGIDLGEGTALRGSVTCPTCNGTGQRAE